MCWIIVKPIKSYYIILNIILQHTFISLIICWNNAESALHSLSRAAESISSASFVSTDVFSMMIMFCLKCYHLIYKVSQQSIITCSPECVLYILIRMVVVYLLECNTFQISIFVAARVFFTCMNLFYCSAYSQFVLSYGSFTYTIFVP